MSYFHRIFPWKCPRRRFLALGLACTIAMVVALPAADGAVIVIDPGHGGNDRGADAAQKVSEKEFNLALARAIARQISSVHRVELTRTADIALAPADRTAAANHQKADLLISLHTGTMARCNPRLAVLFTHDDTRVVLPADRDASDPLTAPAWNRRQKAHQATSRSIAQRIARFLQADPAFDQADLFTGPLVSLMGADRPAILLEVGCIPLTGQGRWQDQLDDLAGPVAAAIEEALAGKIE